MAVDVRAVTKLRWVYAAIGLGVLGLLIVVCAGPYLSGRPGPAGAEAVPASTLDEPSAAPGTRETAVLAGGCFWGVQGVFQHVKGVSEAMSGYAGGSGATANYDAVSSGTTGHAESVRITYAPSQVTYGQLLRIFFAVVHDPTQLDRQGPDDGSQYRSAIFTQDETQKRIAEAYLAQVARAGVFTDPIVTSIEPGAEFFPAERYHQDYLNSNPAYPYIAFNDMPKLADLKRVFPRLYREQPVLVLAGGS